MYKRQVKEGSPLQTINAGQSKTLRIQLSNTTNSILGKIQVTSTLPEGMTFNSSDATKSIYLGRKETAELTLDVVGGKEMTTGTQTIQLKAMYKYGSEIKPEEIPVYLKVTGMDEQAGGSGSLAVTSYKVDKSTVPAGESFKLSVTVQNNTAKAVQGLQVKLDGLATEGITVNGGLDTQTVQNLGKGASTTLTYNMAKMCIRDSPGMQQHRFSISHPAEKSFPNPMERCSFSPPGIIRFR